MNNTSITKKTWLEFRDTGLFWWINHILHTFGWAIVIEFDSNKDLIDCYPARVKYRGFSTESNDAGFEKVSKYLKENADILYQETMEE